MKQRGKKQMLISSLIGVGMIVLNAKYVPYPLNIATSLFIGINVGINFSAYKGFFDY